MRLRRLILIIIASALTCACVKSEMDGNAISFEPVSSKPTKAIITGTEYPTSESFVVSAYHNGTDAYFTDLTASYQSSISLWETSTPEYWPLAGSLTFQAYSPASAGLTIDASGVSVDGYTVQTTEQMTTDLCYGSATVADCSAHPDAVPLVFSHALSQVVFRVKAAEYYSNVTLSLNSLSLGGVYSVGNFSAGTWSDHSSKHDYTISSSPLTLTYSGEEPDVTEISAYLFLPQTLAADAVMNIGYSITQTVSGTDYSVENPPKAYALKTTTVTEWEAGKKYIYTINVGLNNLITFTASAKAWNEQDGGFVVE